MGAGKERGLPVQARSSPQPPQKNKSKHTLALATRTPNGHPWQLELELHRVQLNSYTLDNLSFAGEIQIYLHGNIQLHAVEENSTFASKFARGHDMMPSILAF